jgi:transaldolase
MVVGSTRNEIEHKEFSMRATQEFQQLGQSIWLDNITRELLESGTLARYIHDFSVTGLTSNPTIFEHAIGGGDRYDASIRRLTKAGISEEELCFDLILEDLRDAADLFAPVFAISAGLEGWVSLEVSPLLADNVVHTIQAAKRLHNRAQRENLFIKIPGTPNGIRAIEEVIFSGVPVNVTLLFSPEQVMAAAEAYLRGLERRVVAGLSPKVASVLSLFVSRWDVAVQEKVTPSMQNRLGIAMAGRTFASHCALLASPRWLRLAVAGAQPQRLLWASTGTKDPAAPDTLYVQALAAPNTINTVPEKTLLAFADHGKVGKALPADGGYSQAVIDEFRREGINDDALAATLQRQGVDAFTNSWHALLNCVRAKSLAYAELT